MSEQHKLDSCGNGLIGARCGKCKDFPACREEQAKRLNAYAEEQGWNSAPTRRKGGDPK